MMTAQEQYENAMVVFLARQKQAVEAKLQKEWKAYQESIEKNPLGKRSEFSVTFDVLERETITMLKELGYQVQVKQRRILWYKKKFLVVSYNPTPSKSATE